MVIYEVSSLLGDNLVQRLSVSGRITAVNLSSHVVGNRKRKPK